MFLEGRDLAAAEHGLKRETDKELGCGGEECAERVGGWCENRVDAKCGAEEERG